MNDINFVKNIDNLGRIVIPMDIRRKLQINTGDVLSITCNDKDILLTKYSSLNNNIKIINILKEFVDILSLNVILVDRENVIFSNVFNETEISKDLKSNLNRCVKNEKGVLSFKDTMIDEYYSMVPIITSDGVIGSIICLGNDEKLYQICELISKIIGVELNIT